MDKKYYNSERSVQILISLLKANNIRKIVASPGTTNFSFVGSLQNDPFFEIYSSVDERSAAYLACGLADESKECVVLSCTGSTASRNYYPGLSEAYYRKLPVLAVTSHQGTDRIGHLIFQNIDRRRIPSDIARLSVEMPVVRNDRDYNFAVMQANKAVLELTRDGGGPVHINLFTEYSRDFSVKELPKVRVMKRFQAWDNLPMLPQGKIGVYVGSHLRFDKSLTQAVDRFCATYDAVVICDHTSGYYGRYRLLPTLYSMQKKAFFPIDALELMIHIGGVSAASFSGGIPCKNVWRVNPDGELRDPFKKLTYTFQMSEEMFFNHYAKDNTDKHAFIDKCRKDLYGIYDRIPQLPFSNIWSAMQLSKRLPKGSLLHISASNTRRCWNMFPLADGVESSSNVGCCGIDGCTSALVGASLASPDRICYLVTGDLAFFYDLNVLGNRHVGRNVRILLVNNGVGAEFKLSPHPCYTFRDAANPYMAAMGHYGNKSPELVKHFAQDLGFRYLSANDKEEYLKAVEEFTNPQMSDKPMIFEIFTDHENENKALELMTTIVTDAKGLVKDTVASAVRKYAGEEGIRKVKKILGK